MVRFQYCSSDGVLLHASGISDQIYLTVGMNGTRLLLALSNGTQSQEVYVSHLLNGYNCVWLWMCIFTVCSISEHAKNEKSLFTHVYTSIL